MTEADAHMEEAAIAWVIRTRDPGFTDWEGFTGWLESDPAHGEVYDRLASADADLPALIPATPIVAPAANDKPADNQATDNRRFAQRWRWIGGGAVAAALAGLVSVTALRSDADPYAIQTRPGETRTITQPDGTTIIANGDTLIRLDRNNPRFAALDRGEAIFTVTHDAADPFRVHVGDAVFEDAGTVFNIRRADHETRIGVAEGKVIYNPAAEAIALPAGRSLRAVDGATQVDLRSIAPQAVTGWQRGRLSYDAAPLSEIAADVTRTLGVTIRPAADTRGLRFTGTLQVDRDPARFFASAAPLLGVQAQRQGAAWLLKAGDDTAD